MTRYVSMVTGHFLPGLFPTGHLLSRTFPTQDTSHLNFSHPDTCHRGRFPPRTLPTRTLAIPEIWASVRVPLFFDTVKK